MVAVIRLVTLVDVDDAPEDLVVRQHQVPGNDLPHDSPRGWAPAEPGLAPPAERTRQHTHVSVSTRQEAVLADGRRVLLLGDRGWGSSHPWATISVEDIEETTRMVVGPDEPPENRTWEEAEADHWISLARVLQQHGVTVDAQVLRQLPHDVVLSERVLARIGHDAGTTTL